MKPLHFLKRNTSRLAKKAFEISKNYNLLNQKDKNAQKIEKGRSMVEMLGVLAVIGVLSVGGILGYKYGITKWKANETVNELNLRAHDIAFRMEKLIELDHTGEIEMEMGKVTRLGYPIRARMSPLYLDYFEMFLSDVPSDVCKELLKSQWQAPYSIFVGVTEYEASADICEQAEKVELAYEFYKDLTQKEDVPEESRHKIQRCRHENHCKCGTCNEDTGLCENTCPQGSQCVKSYDDPRLFVCCKADFVMNGFCCASITEDGQCCSGDGKCCPPDKPLKDKNGNCYSCETANGVDVGKYDEYCSACPKRRLMGGYKDQNWCSLCGVKGTTVENKPLFDDNHGKCYSCSSTEAPYQITLTTERDLCENVCPNREVVKEGWWIRCVLPCPTDKPLRSGINSCTTCDYTGNPYSAWQKPSCKEVCSDREDENERCVLPCPPDKPLKDQNSGCHSCSEEDGIAVGTHTEYCDVCKERRLMSGYKGQNWCSLCGAKGTTVENKPLFNDVNGKCYDCNTTEDPYQTTLTDEKDLCENVCPNREMVKDSGSNLPHCVLPCPADKPLRIGHNTCTTCDYNGSPSSAWQNPSCKEVCSDREDQDGYCALSACPSDQPLRDINGNCYSCKEENGVNVGTHSEYCDVCKERRLMSGYKDQNWCSLCGVKGSTVENKPLFDDNHGKCYSCSSTDSPYQITLTDKKDLCENVCPNREVVKEGWWIRCVLPCPADTPLRSGINSCAKCNYTGDPYSAWQQPSCSEVCPNREDKDGRCVLSDRCATDGYFMGTDKICYKCNISTDITVDPFSGECEKCWNRTLFGTTCAINED